MELNKYLDATNLKCDALKKDILALCNEALEYDYACVVVSPSYVSYAKEILGTSNVLVGTVIGFPLGYSKTNVKVFETKEAIKDGADEIDMVINIAALKDGLDTYVLNELNEVLEACEGRTLKVIIETCYLTTDEIKLATMLCNRAHVNFVKTSTGFGPRGATLEDIKIINDVKNSLLEVKASGGITSLEQVNDYIDLGVTRIGTSQAKKIMEELK